jgi:hypothetical protein
MNHNFVIPSMHIQNLTTTMKIWPPVWIWNELKEWIFKNASIDLFNKLMQTKQIQIDKWMQYFVPFRNPEADMIYYDMYKYTSVIKLKQILIVLPNF